MDDAFGGSGWTGYASPTDTSFLTGEDFVYFEGGDGTTHEMEAFLDANATALMAWVAAGGNIFINAAPNEGNGLSFGGMDINYPTTYCGAGCVAVDPAHAVFNGITATDFTGGYFSHGYVTGGAAIIEDGMGDSLLSELTYGSGLILMGTMTTTNWHTFGEGVELGSNILQYAAGGTAAVPLPAALPLLLAGMGGMGMLRLRRRAA